MDNNNRHAKSARNSDIAGLSSAVGGYYGSSAVNTQTANNELNGITDYSRWSKCGSHNISDATDEDIEKSKQPAGVVHQVSSADELKKYKGLLDSGVIAQEEFDAKKKQLLGL